MARLGAEGNACGGTPTKRASALAFQRYQDADRIARLAGVSAGIQRVVRKWEEALRLLTGR